MSGFNDFPIPRRLALMSLASSGLALLIASAGFLAWDLVRFRSELRENLTAQSRALAENSSAALAFDDEVVGPEALRTLAQRPQVRMACLYRVDATPFVGYTPLPGFECPPRPPSISSFGWDAYDVVTPVSHRDEQFGSLYISRGLGDMHARIRVGGLTVFGLLMLAVGVAVVASARMHRSIVTPLRELADTARTITASGEFGLRVEPKSNDEIGVVMRAFNEMLDRLAGAIERERDANRLKDEFLSTLSHELRTPLNAIMGWTRMLRAGHLSTEAGSRALATIERNARAQAMLVNDLLDMSSIVSGKPRLRIRQADLAAVIDAAVEVVRPAASAKQIDIQVAIDVRPAHTYGDPGRLQQIAWNLLANAVKFTPPGGQIDVRLVQEDGYRLTVRDTGLGIDPGFLPLVFDRFRQADGTSTREHGGLGLGLAITKQLVELHGGTIRAHSAGLGSGATFDVHLPSSVPAAVRESEAAMKEQPLRLPDASVLEGVHVLVVDDDEDTRALLDATLSQYGARVTTAATVKDGLAVVDRLRPDVLLSDIGMPGEDGHMLIRLLRDRPPSEGGAIPAVAVSAYASVSDGLAAEAAGFQAHVSKPFDATEVVNLVALLGRRRRSADPAGLQPRGIVGPASADPRAARAGTT